MKQLIEAFILTDERKEQLVRDGMGEFDENGEYHEKFTTTGLLAGIQYGYGGIGSIKLNHTTCKRTDVTIGTEIGRWLRRTLWI